MTTQSTRHLLGLAALGASLVVAGPAMAVTPAQGTLYVSTNTTSFKNTYIQGVVLAGTVSSDPPAAGSKIVVREGTAFRGSAIQPAEGGVKIFIGKNIPESTRTYTVTATATPMSTAATYTLTVNIGRAPSTLTFSSHTTRYHHTYATVLTQSEGGDVRGGTITVTDHGKLLGRAIQEAYERTVSLGDIATGRHLVHVSFHGTSSARPVTTKFVVTVP